jgi:hypothetical protein
VRSCRTCRGEGDRAVPNDGVIVTHQRKICTTIAYGLDHFVHGERHQRWRLLHYLAGRCPIP